MSHGDHKSGWDRRRAEYERATPIWADLKTIARIYAECRKRRRFNAPVCVDHTVPLNHKYVCGLHCEDNLEIISEKENASKSNHWWPDMWEEQLWFDVPTFLFNPQLELSL